MFDSCNFFNYCIIRICNSLLILQMKSQEYGEMIELGKTYCS